MKAFTFRLFDVPVQVRWGFLAMMVFCGVLTNSITIPIVIALSILGHEFSHILMGRRFGYHTQRVMLFFLGGAAMMEERKGSYKEHFWIAIAGPLFNFVTAILALVPYILFSLPDVLTFVLSVIFGINVLIGAFNMIPAYPLDGGRILKNGLCLMGCKEDTATNVAHVVGLLFAILFIGYGFVRLDPGMPIIGGFVAYYILRERDIF